MMIQACLNGGRGKDEHPAVPLSPSELAKDALSVKEAGARAIHFHPRAGDGSETLDPDHVAVSIDRIRRAVPGMPIGVGTGIWIRPGGPERLERIHEWTVLPDYASVNLNEDDAEENMELLIRMNIGIEAGIWTLDDAEKFVNLQFAGRCLRVLLEMTSDDPAEAEDEYRRCIRCLRKIDLDVPVLLHGEGGSVWPMVEIARIEGHDTRVGFEDGLLLPDGRVAKSNAQLVQKAYQLTR